MGFTYRKSVNFGPFRVNLSKSGVGYSVGGKGFRVSTSARARCYSAFSIPGTVILLKDSGLDESNIQSLLSALDDEFLPVVNLEHGNLTYTVVLGEVLGNWEAEKPTTEA
jgi:hypothetical protein